MLGFDALGRLALGQLPKSSVVVLPAAAGSYSVTGVAASFATGFAAAAGAYSISGQAIGFNNIFVGTTVMPLADLVHDIPVLGPIGVAVSGIGTVWQQVLGSDATRRGVIFHNPGNVDVLVAPANLSSQPATDAGALRIYAQSDLVLLSEDEHQNLNTAWMAWVDGGAGVLSILNFSGVNASVPPPMPLASLNQGSGIPSPLASGKLLAAASLAAIGANAQRRGITFHNPGAVNLAVCPSNLVAAIGAGSIILLPGQTRTYMAKPKSRIRVNCGWNAIAASGTNNPLTVLEHLG
jgi:hypothetical protein